MPLILTLCKALGAFFTLAVMLNTARAAEKARDMVLVEGEPVHLEVVNKRFHSEFLKVHALGALSFGQRNPVFQDRKVEITDVLILSNQVFLLVRSALVEGAPKTLLKVNFKHVRLPSGQTWQGLAMDTTLAASATLLSGFVSGEAVAQGAFGPEFPNAPSYIFVAAATTAVIFAAVGLQKWWSTYRVQNEFIELGHVQTLAIGVEEVTDSDGKLVDVRFNNENLSEIANAKLCQLLLEAKGA